MCMRIPPRQLGSRLTSLIRRLTTTLRPELLIAPAGSPKLYMTSFSRPRRYHAPTQIPHLDVSATFRHHSCIYHAYLGFCSSTHLSLTSHLHHLHFHSASHQRVPAGGRHLRPSLLWSRTQILVLLLCASVSQVSQTLSLPCRLAWAAATPTPKNPAKKLLELTPAMCSATTLLPSDLPCHSSFGPAFAHLHYSVAYFGPGSPHPPLQPPRRS